MSIPSAKTTVRWAAPGLPEWPGAPTVTYTVPDRHNGYLLVATFRVRADADGVLGDAEEADYRCLDVYNTSVVTRGGRRLREYRGILLDKDSFAAAVAALGRGELPAEIRRRMAADSGPICSWALNEVNDPYEEYLPAEKPDQPSTP